MFYDYDLYYPTYYRPRYYSTYSPSYYIGDRYNYSYQNYIPWRSWHQRYPLAYPSLYDYCTTSAYVPYRSSCNYLYSIPSYTSRPVYTSVAPSKMLSPPIFPESEMYAFTYGSDFNAMKDDIRSAASKLQEIRRPRASSVPRFARQSNCAALYDSDIDYYRFQRGLTKRMTSEEPRSRSIKF
ncbi:uncharacterized protein LOC119084178 [Bradysia coprophila]|uniref:uncharacterized protein LOC119084178 n=1 Tax=Bradysia coprophila TaxID=38358 RepID=UPI00187DB195|nr:uncharacterized protein LOC119084178 [Bradysia coprophila]XP_037049934.1 uncharacterized protein LOC119084178 [Bradysia coprophila]